MAYDVDDAGGREPRRPGGRGPARGIRGLLTVPLAVVSAVAVTLGIAQPAEAAPQPVKRQPKAKASTAGAAVRAASATGAVPAEIVVAEGDTVSGIAERYGLSTAEVLAHNGLGWSSLIFPGQRLALPGGRAAAAPPARDAIAKHLVVDGDTMSGIADRYGVALGELLRVNGLGRQSLIFPGEAIVLPPDADDRSAGASAPPPVTAPPAAEPGATAPADTHLVVDGDTVWDIAARNDVEVAALIAANGLDANATIRAGQRLAIPRSVPVVAVASVSVVLTEEMRTNAQLIVDVGRELGVPDSGIVVALAAAAQESGLKNVRHGDRDSQGLFQQRPSQGWGTVEEVLDPVRAATAFYGGPTNPNPGVTAGLLDIPGWESMSLTEAAQSVQRSAHPDHYAKWEAQAKAWLAELG